ncbi:hypothetical protein HLB44_12675 [Aquincola sp. S2]|uniref:Uncharacterized protein n=1 Tax=Pseudaquabacterium terrae TaxID=2732868 RepID=A0ABX2EGV6_9BURK|nr:hypothetical protein [Aquabacterium terrae]NRF67840.1 hypothetical protein [Aquabacterium terrae]
MKSSVRVALRVLFVVWTGLIGLSLPVARPELFERPIVPPVVGVTIGILALWIASLTYSRIANLLPPVQAQKLIGLKIMLGAFILASLGWLIAVFLHQRSGIVIAGLAVLVGFVGMAIHFLHQFSSEK